MVELLINFEHFLYLQETPQLEDTCNNAHARPVTQKPRRTRKARKSQKSEREKMRVAIPT